MENSYDADRPRKRICMDAKGVIIERQLNSQLLQIDEPKFESTYALMYRLLSIRVAISALISSG